ncbi:MAG TPA: hypothetical protein VK249_26345 [Anaerolineales bacterium]|nr:hypothetical protein [Anaerolineales bacterium]
MATPKAIAEWMLGELKQETILSQEVIAHEISLLFGEEFTYTNADGDLAIDERVLCEFRNLTEDMVVSIGGERVWRLKQ